MSHAVHVELSQPCLILNYFVLAKMSEQLSCYGAKELEMQVLHSDDLFKMFIAAHQWVFMSKSRRRCKTAVAGLYQLAVQHFGNANGRLESERGSFSPAVLATTAFVHRVCIKLK
jgi:hypothetical protein